LSEIIASVSGVRGIMGDSLTPQNITKFTSAFAEYCKINSRSSRIVVGRDGRLHGDVISAMVISNLIIAGFEVISIGIVPTPTVQIATEDLKAAGGISITASHNPQIWNGLKFLNPDGTFLDEVQVKEFLNIAQEGSFSFAPVNRIRSIKADNTWPDKHISKVLKLKSVNLSSIKKRRFKIVVDTVNSSGSFIVPKLLEKMGCRVFKLFCDGSGIFPHTPEPLPQNLKQLSKAVKEKKADFGVAIDPDSDRLVLITDKGEPFSEENTITTAVNYILRRNKGGTATVNLSTTRAVDDVAAANGGKVYRSAVGEINVVKLMQSNGSVIGGEGSGGVILPGLHYGRDAIVGLALVLSEFAQFNGKVSDYKKQLPQYFILKAKMENITDPVNLLEKVVAHHREKDCDIILTDGVKLDFKEHWIHLRKSNTEPIIRIIIEAKSKKAAEAVQKDFFEEINSIMIHE
jgi:phosphomannomutase